MWIGDFNISPPRFNKFNKIYNMEKQMFLVELIQMFCLEFIAIKMFFDKK